MVQWTISSDERRELERAAGRSKPELPRMGVIKKSDGGESAE
jgi:hypothetical protein